MTLSAQKGGPPDSPRSPPTRTVAIVGAGMMGVAVAAANVRHAWPVVLIDSDRNALATAVQRIAAELADGADSSEDRQAAVADLVTTTTELDRVGDCEVVLETIVEIAVAKQKLLGELERQSAPTALLASNTSTIPIARLAAAMSDASRFCGLHFFHPVRRRPLVEVVLGPLTSHQTVDAAMAYVRAIAKVPLRVVDGPGFVVNRLLTPYLTEAMDLLLEGESIERIEQAAVDFGMALGPFRLADEIGLDTILLGGRVLWEAFPNRITPSPVLIALYKAGRRGRKSGAGFFCYAGVACSDEPRRLDPRVNETISTWKRDSRSSSDEQIVARLLMPMVLEATRILEEGKVAGPPEIDVATVLGLGFPASQGGLLRWADQQGIQAIVDGLRSLESLGPRFQPSRSLLEMARSNSLFHP